MGKKILRKNYTGSKGVHSSVAGSTIAAVRAAKSPLDKLAGIHAAWKAGKNPWVTVSNENANPKNNKRFIRVKSNDYWGKPSSGFLIGKQAEGSATA